VRRRFLRLLALAAMAAATPYSRAAIVSPDLQLWAQNARSTDTTAVVIQLAPGLTGGSIANLFGSARLMGDYKKLSMVSAVLTPADVARFGADADNSRPRPGDRRSAAPAVPLPWPAPRRRYR